MSGWRPVPARFLAAVISAALSTSGWSDWTLIPYFAVKSVIICAVVRPVGRRGDEVDLALGLAGGTDGVHAAGVGG